MLGEVFHGRAHHVALALADRLDRLDGRGIGRSQRGEILARGLDDGLDIDGRQLELAGILLKSKSANGS